MLPKVASRLLHYLAGLTSFLLPLWVYSRTVAPTIYGLDSPELTTAAYTLGRAHPPGYPLYLLIGHTFIQLMPWGDAGYRLNLMSALFGALTVTTVYRLLRQTKVRPLAALAASLCLAFSFYFWAPATMAEVYTLHCFLTTLILMTLLNWHQTGQRRWLLALAGLYGLSFGNHTSVVLLFPGLAWSGGYLFWAKKRPGLWTWPLVGLCFLLGLSVYVYLPLRAGVRSWNDFFNLVSAHSFWSLVARYTPTELGGEVWSYLVALWGNFLGFGLGLGLLGFCVTWRRDRHLAFTELLMFGATVAFFASYRVADKYLMLGVAWVLWSLWIGPGFQWLADLVTLWILDRLQHQRQKRPARSPGLTAHTARLVCRYAGDLLFLCAAFGLVAVNYRHTDLSANASVRKNAEAILNSVPPNAVVVSFIWTEVNPLTYLQVVEARRPDVTVVNWYAYPINANLANFQNFVGTRPLYSTRTPPQLPPPYTVQWLENCQCYQVHP